MRILYFTRDYSTHDHRFLTTLAKTQHQIYYLRLEHGANTFETRPIPEQVEQVQWAGGQRKARLLDSPFLLASLKNVVRKIQPDIIQAGPLQRSAFLAALSGLHRGTKPRLISMSWGYDLIFDARRNYFWGAATRYTLQRSAVMIGDCDTIRHLAASYGMPDERIVTFPWGIDLDFFKPADSTIQSSVSQDLYPEDQPFLLLSTRNWESLYGIDVIAHAFVKATKRNPRLRLVMLGNGSQGDKIRNIFAAAGVSDRVQFPGQIKQADLPAYFQSTDLYLSASHSDGTSISLLEAMACAKPALVSDIPGNREWIQPGVQGDLFPDGDSDALASAILSLSSQPELLKQMGGTARQAAEKRADWNKNFQQLLHAYELAYQTNNSPGMNTILSNQ